MFLEYTPYDMVNNFRAVFEKKNEFSVPNMVHQFNLIEEEVSELYEEVNAFEHAKTNEYKKHHKELLTKELCDLIYVCYDMAIALKLPIEEAFKRVHESNMSKLGEDGKPIRREDGKILKGPNYKQAVLTDLF